MKNNFFLTLTTNRKKLDKYIKINKVKNKYIIDINEMLREEEMSYAEATKSDLFKILILKRFTQAQDKCKDIYYIPHIEKAETYMELFNIKRILSNTHNFNLLYFYNDYKDNLETDVIFNNIDKFDNAQILKDY